MASVSRILLAMFQDPEILSLPVIRFPTVFPSSDFGSNLTVSLFSFWFVYLFGVKPGYHNIFFSIRLSSVAVLLSALFYKPNIIHHVESFFFY